MVMYCPMALWQSIFIINASLRVKKILNAIANYIIAICIICSPLPVYSPPSPIVRKPSFTDLSTIVIHIQNSIG